MTKPEFKPFPKIARLSRDVIITEKIDGTNAQIHITDDGDMFFGSRTRWITPEDDNFGFAKWAEGNKQELFKLGPGSHFGEWWGLGIQRHYNLTEKRLSLFNVARWCLHNEEPKQIKTSDPRIVKMQERLPECVGLVPVLHRGEFNTFMWDACLERLKLHGSAASNGFMNPEGIVVFHAAAGVGFKKTIEKDEEPKGFSK